VPLARPISPNNYPFLKRDKINNKINQNEILDDYHELKYYLNYEETVKKKKLIKIQDCTDWLAYKQTRQKKSNISTSNNNNNNSNKSTLNNSGNVFRHYSAFVQKTTNPTHQSTSFSTYFQSNYENDSNIDTGQQQLYKINMLLNRKSARVKT